MWSIPIEMLIHTRVNLYVWPIPIATEHCYIWNVTSPEIMKHDQTFQNSFLWVNGTPEEKPKKKLSPHLFSKRGMGFGFRWCTDTTVWEQHSFVVRVDDTRSKTIVFSHGFILGSLLAQCCEPVLHCIIRSTHKTRKNTFNQLLSYS